MTLSGLEAGLLHSGLAPAFPYNRRVDRRAAAFARLFEAVHEGVYIGTIGPEHTSTIAANPHLKLIFGYASEAPEPDVRPFDRERFVDPQARVALLERLTTDGSRRPTTCCGCAAPTTRRSGSS